MSTWSARVLTGALLALALAGCKPAAENVAAAKSAATRPAPPAKTEASARVARVVFVDQEKCCACTRKRIDSSWKALTAVVGATPRLPVDRYHLDTQEVQAEEFLSKKPIMAAPGIYFLDKAGALVELLQGEVTEAQIRSALAK